MPEDDGTQDEQIHFSTKAAEEVGFDKFARRQAQLQGIHVLVLDYMHICAQFLSDERDEILRICADITELDLSGNLFESLDEILDICKLIPKLQSLVLDGNHFPASNDHILPNDSKLHNIRSLSLSKTLLTWPEISLIAVQFPDLRALTLANNSLSATDRFPLLQALSRIDLSGNSFTSLSDLKGISSCTSLRSLMLKHNYIHAESTGDAYEDSTLLFSKSLNEVDLAFNHISSWSFINSLANAFPGMKHLRTSGNPLYNHLRSAEGRTLTTEVGHMLTLARLPQLETLNYSKISEKERLNAETYYLGQIAVDLSNASPEKGSEILRQHPRWSTLCEEYGEPTIRRKPGKDEVDPDSLAARLVTFTFELAPGTFSSASLRTWSEEIPKSCSLYSILGRVGKRLGVMPLKLRLIWETGEQDPAGRASGYNGPEWWDSSDDEAENAGREHDLVWREVELSPGTAAVGTYIESHEAKIRVEMMTD